MRRRQFSIEEGSVTAEELAYVEKLVKAAQDLPGPIIEIGTLFGRTTTRLALAAPAKTIITVDCYRWNPWGLDSQSHAAVTALVLDYLIHTHRVKQIHMHKKQFYHSYNGHAPALIFIDADHSYESVRQDIAWAKQNSAGIICGHDYSPSFPGVMQAVHEVGGPDEVCGTVFKL